MPAAHEVGPCGRSPPADIAYLEDRVSIRRRGRQRYGTQFWIDADGTHGPRPIEDPGGLERRRAEAGLETFASYETRMMRREAERRAAGC